MESDIYVSSFKNALYAGVNSADKGHFYFSNFIYLFIFKCSKSSFWFFFWILHENCIQINTNKPCIGLAVLEK